MEEERRCPLCNGPFRKKDNVSIAFNGLCMSCAKSTYIVYRDIFIRKI